MGSKPLPVMVIFEPGEPVAGVTAEIFGVAASRKSNVFPGGRTPSTASSPPNVVDEPLNTR